MAIVIILMDNSVWWEQVHIKTTDFFNGSIFIWHEWIYMYNAIIQFLCI